MSVTWPEIERLYRQHAPRLQRTVRVDVRASDSTIEDACQAAWKQLIDHRERVRSDAALPWLTRTAVREAVRLSRLEARKISLDALAETRGGARGLEAVGAPGVHEPFGHRERLRALRSLPVRQRRLLWLQGLGLSYAEMAALECCTRRTVERQLMRAKRAAAEL